jgi:transketolase
LHILPKEDWENWGKNKDTCLRVFGNVSIPGIDMTSGSLGHGVGVGAGMALADPNKHVYVIISEGELYEGSTWEALLFVAHRQIPNMTIFIDVNNLIILGQTDDCLKLNSIQSKLSGFEFDIFTVDGHNTNSIEAALDATVTRPKIIIANTVKGKGFSLMENKPEWHYMQPITPEQIEQCRKEINDATA